MTGPSAPPVATGGGGGTGRNLVLSGMMGSGKSTIGRIVAARLGRPLVDTDRAVEEAAGASVAELFAARGEAGFRQLESEVVAEIAATGGQVISLGGGVVTVPANVEALRATGLIVFIDAPLDALVARLASSSSPGKRPLLAGEQDPQRLRARLAALRAERYDAYRASAAYVLDTEGRPSEAVAGEVQEWAMHHPDLLSASERA